MIDKKTIDIIIADFDNTRLNNLMMNIQRHPNIRVVAIAGNGKDLVERAASMKVDAVLMDFALIDATAINVANELRSEAPGTMVFAISDSVSSDFIFEAKNAGVKEVYKRETFVAQSTGEDIYRYVQEQRKEWEDNASKYGAYSKGKGPKDEKIVKEYLVQTIKQAVVLTYNTKGGVGKSTIATNLAIALKKSPYTSGNRIAIVDFDCGGANISTLYNIPDSQALTKNLIYWLNIDENITGEEVDEMMITGPYGLKILPAPLNFGVGQQVDFDLANNILAILKKYYDLIIIDGAPNISPTVDAAMQHASHILLIANKEGQSVKQLSRIVTLFNVDPITNKDYSYLLNKMYVVINEAQQPSKWDLNPQDIARTINRPILREVPYSEFVKESLHGNSGKQAIELDENSEFSIAIKRLANDICGAYPDVTVGVSKVNKKDKSKGKQKEKNGLFNKMLRRG